MKHYVDFFRIKVILVIAIVVLPIVFLVTLVNTLSGDKAGFCTPITFENAPEGTAYVDILVKLPVESEENVDFAEWENPPGINKIGYKEVTEGNSTYNVPVYEKEILITPESEIAKLNDDGYVSLSVHYAGSRGFQGTELNLDYHGGRNNDIEEIQKRYGKFKAAYVDENGSVLGITKKARTRYDPQEASNFSANGDKLTFTIWGLSPLHYILLFGSFFGEPLAIIALIVFIIVEQALKPKPDLPPRANRIPRSIEERNKDNDE